MFKFGDKVKKIKGGNNLALMNGIYTVTNIMEDIFVGFKETGNLLHKIENFELVTSKLEFEQTSKWDKKMTNEETEVDKTLDLITKNAKLEAGIRFVIEWINDNTLKEILRKILKEIE